MASITFGTPSPLEKRILKEIEDAMNDVAPLNHRLLELIMNHRKEVIEAYKEYIRTTFDVYDM